MLDNLMTGLALMASVESFIAILIGLLAGIIIGAIPGLTADIAIILCLPITYSMEPIPAMLLLLGLYCGGTYGGSITAILINTPGTPSSAATVLDGYPLTQQGKPLKALTMALYASFFGGLFSALVLLFAAPSIARFTQMFGPPEYFLHRSVWIVYYCKHLERQYHQGSARRPDRYFHCTAGTGFGQRYASVYLWCPSTGRRYPADRYAGRSVRNCRIAQPLGL